MPKKVRTNDKMPNAGKVQPKKVTAQPKQGQSKKK